MKIKNLSNEVLEKEYHKVEQRFKRSSITFLISLLIIIGYSGYAKAQGSMFHLLPTIIGIISLLAGLLAGYYYKLTKLKTEIIKRENSNQT